MEIIPAQAVNELRAMYPRSFNELMAAFLTLLVWLLAVLTYLQDGKLNEQVFALVTFSWGYWLKPPGQG